jgi:GLPGLI family protein
MLQDVELVFQDVELMFQDVEHKIYRDEKTFLSVISIFSIMSRKFFLIIALTFTASSYAQGPDGVFPIECHFLGVDKYTVLDEASYKISYTLTCVHDTVSGGTIQNNLILLIGPDYSKFFNIYPPHPELKSGAGYVFTDESRGLGGTEVYKDLKRKRMTVTTRLFEPRADVFFYQEDIPTQTWALTPESKQVLGYNCQKATTRYLGRDYEAWYTLDIPISNGPWKLGGLPGMILEAYDTQRHYVFDCTNIEKLKETEPIVKYDWHYVKKSRKDLQNVLERYHDDMLAYLTLVLWNRSSSGRVSPKPVPYNPLERE